MPERMNRLISPTDWKKAIQISTSTTRRKPLQEAISDGRRDAPNTRLGRRLPASPIMERPTSASGIERRSQGQAPRMTWASASSAILPRSIASATNGNVIRLSRDCRMDMSSRVFSCSLRMNASARESNSSRTPSSSWTHGAMKRPTGRCSAAVGDAAMPPHWPCPMTTMLSTLSPLTANVIAADVPWCPPSSRSAARWQQRCERRIALPVAPRISLPDQPGCQRSR
jgi:hypothetical protein